MRSSAVAERFRGAPTPPPSSARQCAGCDMTYRAVASQRRAVGRLPSEPLRGAPPSPVRRHSQRKVGGQRGWTCSSLAMRDCPRIQVYGPGTSGAPHTRQGLPPASWSWHGFSANEKPGTRMLCEMAGPRSLVLCRRRLAGTPRPTRRAVAYLERVKGSGWSGASKETTSARSSRSVASGPGQGGYRSAPLQNRAPLHVWPSI